MKPRSLFGFGGIIASLVLIAFGVAAIVIGYQGREEVRDTLAREHIVGTPDSDIPGQKVDTGSEARSFADTMREHTMKSTGGLTYSELPRYIGPDGQGTNDANLAVKDQFGKPLDNPLRNLWVTETALTTSLNTAYFAEQVGLFAIVMGTALVLTGAGFAVLTLGALWKVDFGHKEAAAPAEADDTAPRLAGLAD
ncbi:MAG: hypothetical protein ACM3S1_12470 [Hyphomicrobiales bacterium]